MAGGVAYAVIDRAVCNFRIGDYDNPSKVKTFTRAGRGHKYAVDVKNEYYDRFGIKYDTIYESYTPDQAEKHIEDMTAALNDWHEREYPGD